MNKTSLIVGEESVYGRRSSVMLMVGMLRAALKGARKTEIVYKTNLNFRQAQKYLDFLLSKGLITVECSSGRSKTYRTTEKGRAFIERYEKTLELIS